jgi:hypothetical protein
MAFLILTVSILGLVAASQAIQIKKLSHTLYSEYIDKKEDINNQQ